jgi:adenosylmethionine-8-amino-7-oxononanoate aminotransferase
MTKNSTELLQQDHQYIWHPCSQMKDYETFNPLIIKKARGSYIELTDGNKIIDAISSWWCKSLGHNHPQLKQALFEQANDFEHVLFANTTHKTIIELSQELASICQPLSKIFYAGDGSCAVEIALKMSLHTRLLQGDSQRNHFIALQNGYHGETCGAMSVSDLGLYKDPYQAMLFKPHFISPIPYVSGPNDPLWHDCGSLWSDIEKSLEPFIASTTAIIIEPIVQGAAGMKIYSQDFLRRLRQWSTRHDIHLIADEIMTGIGRTGKMLACEHAGIIPDFICLSKGLTSGWMPFSTVLMKEEIYNYFYADYQTGKSFLHSHTFSGNPLAASIALATLKVIKNDNLVNRANEIGHEMLTAMLDIADRTKKITNIRSIGAMVAVDLINHTNQDRLGFHFYQKAVKNGALLRPLGNTIYWLPPLNIKMSTLEELKAITLKTLLEL